ncbi:hypothetical protein CA13_72740 [Planctomycetes bacterium CA13]|uniref:Uncharacterized protein n=1 Tax=Novipirellula herctigrandis TaxID=2527986 RepID=A0A5C5YPF0_9BACT|nr:hypothetical protein CA13_72740 [Planctomycetes bacterium CA13]
MNAAAHTRNHHQGNLRRQRSDNKGRELTFLIHRMSTENLQNVQCSLSNIDGVPFRYICGCPKNQQAWSTRSTIVSAIAIDAVAAGDGALRT